MDLLERYLQAVKKHLPWKRQDDIIAELRANLEAQLEDREAELHRTLTVGEMEAWLKQMGAPAQVAARYQGQQYLIGPALYPHYRYVLQLAFTWALVIYAVVSVVQLFMADHPGPMAFLEVILRVPWALITTAVCVTAVFAAIEMATRQWPEKFPALDLPRGDWKPSELPALEPEDHSGKKPRTMAHAVAEVVCGFVALVWLLLVPQYPFLLFGPGVVFLKIFGATYQLAPVWLQFYWWIVALNIVQVGWRAELLWRGRWQHPRMEQTLTVKLIGLMPLVLLLAAKDHALVLLRPDVDTAHYAPMLDAINHWAYRSVLIVFVIGVGQVVFWIGRMVVDGQKRRVAGMQRG
jgi:hypothetical protein